MRIHSVQHVFLLDSAHEDPLPSQTILPPLPVDVDDESEYYVEQVLDSRIRYNRLEYLIKWLGYDQPEWELVKDVNKIQVIDDFHRTYSHKSGPLPEDLF